MMSLSLGFTVTNQSMKVWLGNALINRQPYTSHCSLTYRLNSTSTEIRKYSASLSCFPIFFIQYIKIILPVLSSSHTLCPSCLQNKPNHFMFTWGTCTHALSQLLCMCWLAVKETEWYCTECDRIWQLCTLKPSCVWCFCIPENSSLCMTWHTLYFCFQYYLVSPGYLHS